MKARYWTLLAAAAALAGWAARRRSHPRTCQLELPGTAGSADEAEEASLLFIGTATVLIRFAGLTFLTDPNFLHRGEHVHIGYGLHSERLTNPAISFEDLPEIDFVLLSHLHEDHFDKLVERRLRRDVPIVTTASAARALRRRGFTRTYPMKRWDAIKIHKGPACLSVTSMPGTHGPLMVAALLPEVMGSMLEFHDDRNGFRYRMYISGDTLVFRDLLEIPRRYPHVDLALLHLGGTRVLGILVTMDAEQGIRALRIIDPDKAIPIHYDDYDIFNDPLENFVRAVKAAGLHDKVHYLQRGESYSFAAQKIPLFQ